MTGRSYIILLENVSVSTLRTLIEFTNASTKVCEVLRAWVTQTNSEVSTQEEVEMIRKSAAGTGTSATPAPTDGSDTAFGGSARVNCTAEGTTGTRVWREGMNILSGWLYQPVPEERIVVPGSGILALRWAQTPEAAIDVTAGMVLREIG